MRVLVLLILALICAGDAAAQVKSVEVSRTRQFGHFVGDVLHSEVDVTVDPSYTLEDASVPKTGAVNQWLDIIGSRIKEESRDGARVYRIFLDYQTFYPALDARELAIPGFDLSFASGDHRVTAKVPDGSFLISPLREVSPAAKASGEAYMMPDVPIDPVDLGPLQIAFSASVALLLVMLALLAHRLAWWPFLAPKNRPFVRAARQVRRLLADTQDGATYRQSLQIVHRAIDETAGRAILGDDLPDFLRDAPAYSRLRDDFAAFFQSSRRVFFAETSRSTGVFGAHELRHFCDDLAATERAAG